MKKADFVVDVSTGGRSIRTSRMRSWRQVRAFCGCANPTTAAQVTAAAGGRARHHQGGERLAASGLFASASVISVPSRTYYRNRPLAARRSPPLMVRARHLLLRQYLSGCRRFAHPRMSRTCRQDLILLVRIEHPPVLTSTTKSAFFIASMMIATGRSPLPRSGRAGWRLDDLRGWRRDPSRRREAPQDTADWKAYRHRTTTPSLPSLSSGEAFTEQ